MPQSYTPEFKKEIARLHLEEGRTYKSITAEYGVSKASISKWCSEFSEECQTCPKAKEEYDNWRYHYPKFDTTQIWAKVPSKELSDALVEAFKDRLPD